MPPDQPAPPVHEVTREHREAAVAFCYGGPGWRDLCIRQLVLFVEHGEPAPYYSESGRLAQEFASRDAAAEARGRLLERERLAPVLEAFSLAKTYVGCGDNSCLFVKPQGMATNGGCRCVERGTGRPFVTAALAGIYKALAALAAQPKESATPAVEGPALEKKMCGLCGGDGFHVQGPGQYRDCERCEGTGKEPT